MTHPSPIEQASQRNWNEVQSFHRDRDRWKSIICAGAIVVAGLAVARGWYHDSEPKLIPYVVDRNGPSLLTARLEQHMPDAARIEGHLRDWIREVRTVSSDPAMQAQLYNHAFSCTDSGSIGYQQLQDWYRANLPADRAKIGTVNVTVTSVIPQGGGDGWLIDWTETAYAPKPGKLTQVSYWRMTVTTHIHLPETEEEFATNWDGVFVTSLHIESLEHAT